MRNLLVLLTETADELFVFLHVGADFIPVIVVVGQRSVYVSERELRITRRDFIDGHALKLMAGDDVLYADARAGNARSPARQISGTLDMLLLI